MSFQNSNDYTNDVDWKQYYQNMKKVINSSSRIVTKRQKKYFTKNISKINNLLINEKVWNVRYRWIELLEDQEIFRNQLKIEKDPRVMTLLIEKLDESNPVHQKMFRDIFFNYNQWDNDKSNLLCSLLNKIDFHNQDVCIKVIEGNYDYRSKIAAIRKLDEEQYQEILIQFIIDNKNYKHTYEAILKLKKETVVNLDLKRKKIIDMEIRKFALNNNYDIPDPKDPEKPFGRKIIPLISDPSIFENIICHNYSLDYIFDVIEYLKEDENILLDIIARNKIKQEVIDKILSILSLNALKKGVFFILDPNLRAKVLNKILGKDKQNNN